MIVRLFAFALGGAAATVLRVYWGVSMLWAVVGGIVIYVAFDLIAEHLLFGHLIQ